MGRRKCSVGMTSGMGALEIRDIEVGVNLGGLQAGVSKHLLHVAKIGSAVEHMSGARVAKDMRGQVIGNADPLPRRSQYEPDPLS